MLCSIRPHTGTKNDVEMHKPTPLRSSQFRNIVRYFPPHVPPLLVKFAYIYQLTHGEHQSKVPIRFVAFQRAWDKEGHLLDEDSDEMDVEIAT